MKLSERFEQLTDHELRRAITVREHLIVKAEWEIRALQKLLRKRAIAALPDSLYHTGAARAKAS